MKYDRLLKLAQEFEEKAESFPSKEFASLYAQMKSMKKSLDNCEDFYECTSLFYEVQDLKEDIFLLEQERLEEGNINNINDMNLFFKIYNEFINEMKIKLCSILEISIPYLSKESLNIMCKEISNSLDERYYSIKE
jgi:hypothetical protein